MSATSIPSRKGLTVVVAGVASDVPTKCAGRARWVDFAMLAGLALAAGCGGSEPALRQYQEVVVEAPTRQERVADVAAMARQMPPAGGDMASTPVATGSVALKWTVPEGWVEQPGQAMRMATFLVGPDRRECTIVSFPGDVGGIEANLRRWIGQLEATVADEALAKFARAPETFQSEGGLGCLVYDFSSLLPAGSAQSMLAAIVPMDGQTVFVKLMGPRDLLAAERERFLGLCRSLKP